MRELVDGGDTVLVPEHRGHGLGRALMDAVLREARDRGADTIDLGTSEDDVAARRLYERSGFTTGRAAATVP